MISTLSQVFHYVCRGRWLVNRPSMLRRKRFEISQSVLTPTTPLGGVWSTLQNDRIYLGFFLNERSTPQVTGKIAAFPWKSRSEAPQHLQKFRYHICSSACTNLLESEMFVFLRKKIKKTNIYKFWKHCHFLIDLLDWLYLTVIIERGVWGSRWYTFAWHLL